MQYESGVPGCIITIGLEGYITIGLEGYITMGLEGYIAIGLYTCRSIDDAYR